MQVLTAQYPSLYTRKFRVTFQDFNTIASRRNIINLFTLPKGNQIVQVAGWTENRFIGGAITDSILGVYQSNNVPAVGATTNYMGVFRTFNTSAPRNGLLQSLVSINSITAPTANQNWCNFNEPTIIQIGMQVSTGHLCTQLTQGSALVWVTSMRLS